MRPPSGIASRALASRLKNTCSSSLRLPKTKGLGVFGDVQLHAGQLQVLLHQVGGLGDRLGQVHAAAFAARGPREIQQALDDAAALFGLPDDPVDVLAVVFVLDRVFEHLGRQQDRTQRRVELVRDARGQLPDARQLFGFAHAAFQLLFAR